MAIKKPLCLYGGQPTELKTGDTLEGATSAGGLAPGTIVRSGKTAPAGTIRCNGALLSRLGNPALYAAIGDDFAWIANRYNNGKPHRMQYGFNMTNPGNLDWSAAPSGLPGALAHSQAIVTNSRVYLLGGYNGSTIVSTVYTAPINAGGTLGAWAVGVSLPAPLHVHQAIMTNSRVYLLGGQNGSAAVSTVYTAPINADGTLGAWTTASNLPAALSSSQAIVTNSRVYLLGGHNGSAAVSTVYTAPINADGTLGAWTTATSLAVVLASCQAVVTNSRVYLLGGQTPSGPVSAAYYGAFTGGLNNYLNMTFSRDDISTGFFIPDTRREDAMYPDESCRSYIAY